MHRTTKVKEHKRTSALNENIIEVELDIVEADRSYDQLIRRLATDIQTLIREQLTTYGYIQQYQLRFIVKLQIQNTNTKLL